MAVTDNFYASSEIWIRPHSDLPPVFFGLNERLRRLSKLKLPIIVDMLYNLTPMLNFVHLNLLKKKKKRKTVKSL